MSLTLCYENDPNEKDIDFLLQGITTQAQLKKGLDPIEPFGFFLKDENQLTQGGVNGIIYYGCLYIDQLYIKEALQGKGWGTKLITAAEDLAIAKGCTFSTVCTMDWEGLDFYQKLGYTIEHERKGYQNNSVMYVLRKELTPQ